MPGFHACPSTKVHDRRKKRKRRNPIHMAIKIPGVINFCSVHGLGEKKGGGEKTLQFNIVLHIPAMLSPCGVKRGKGGEGGGGVRMHNEGCPLIVGLEG